MSFENIYRKGPKRAVRDLACKTGSEEIESGEQVEFVHQVQILPSVLPTVLDCEDGILRGFRSLSGKFSDYAARVLAGNRADAGYLMQMQATHSGVAGEVSLRVGRENECNPALSRKMA